TLFAQCLGGSLQGICFAARDNYASAALSQPISDGVPDAAAGPRDKGAAAGEIEESRNRHATLLIIAHPPSLPIARDSDSVPSPDTRALSSRSHDPTAALPPSGARAASTNLRRCPCRRTSATKCRA